MLIRGNLYLHHPRIGEAVRKCVRYFLETQKGDGKWSDPSWADLDAVSHPITFLDVLLAVGKRLVDERTLATAKDPWRGRMKLVLDRKPPDGGCSAPEFHPSGVGLSGHLREA